VSFFHRFLGVLTPQNSLSNLLSFRGPDQHPILDSDVPLDIKQCLMLFKLVNLSSQRQLLVAYRRLIFEHHPDKFHHMGNAAVYVANRRAQRINHARDLLMKRLLRTV
jgi:hypothetical protein